MNTTGADTVNSSFTTISSLHENRPLSTLFIVKLCIHGSLQNLYIRSVLAVNYLVNTAPATPRLKVLFIPCTNLCESLNLV